MPDTEHLLPCPFCGAVPAPTKMSDAYTVWHKETCWLMDRCGQATWIEKTMSAWNRRASPSTTSTERRQTLLQ